MAAPTTSLLNALGIEDLLPEEQEELLLDLNSLIWEGSLIRLIEKMDDSTKEAFEKLLAADASEDEIQAFLTEHVPDADQAVTDTVQELTDDILAVTSAS
jgi:hypothetical protein